MSARRGWSTAVIATAVLLAVFIAVADLPLWRTSLGFDPGSARDGFGLSGLTDRLALVHGTLDVRSAVGAGTTLVAELPTAGVTA